MIPHIGPSDPLAQIAVQGVRRTAATFAGNSSCVAV
jgi:hypothetical protein